MSRIAEATITQEFKLSHNFQSVTSSLTIRLLPDGEALTDKELVEAHTDLSYQVEQAARHALEQAMLARSEAIDRWGDGASNRGRY